MNIRDFKTIQERRGALAQERKIRLSHIGKYSLDEQVASTRNCENMIGVAQIPMGVAGPLALKNSDGNDGGVSEYYIPLATTEGALIASVSRGAKAVTLSGGASASAFRVGASRGLVFLIDGVKSSERFAKSVYQAKASYNRIAKTTSSHITLTDMTVKTVGKHAFVRLVFDTQDAMGMNMVTIAADRIAQEMSNHTKTRCIAVAGNYDVDKKPSWLNVIRGRGWEARADIQIPKQILAKVLKTEARAMYDVWLAKCMIGSALSGSMGFNAHYANIVAALFLATGQDAAHVSEASVGITTAEVIDKDLYVSVYLPDLMVGTVGGGTALATQKEALDILGISGGNNGDNAKKLAEVVAASVLSGEISLLASLSQGTLASAHSVLARGGK